MHSTSVTGEFSGPGGRDPVGFIKAGVDALLEVDVSELSDVVLADQLLGLRRQIDRQEAGFAEMAVLAHRRGLGSIDGASSTAAWLRNRAGMRHGNATKAIRVGEALEVMPITEAAWRSGEISANHGRWITEAWVEGFEDAARAVEGDLVAHAMRGEIRALKAGLERIREFTRPDTVFEQRGLSVSRTFRGAVVGDFTLDAEGGELLMCALEAYTDLPTPEDERTHSQRRADGLVTLCRNALDIGTPGHVVGTERPHVSVIIDYETLVRLEREQLAKEGRAGKPGRAGSAGQTGKSAVCELERTGPISAQTARRIACDAGISRIIMDPNGIPLDVGRTRRTIPPPL
ncbi:MAG: DUF222 domain-containing protein, partial [Acidimicrobiia bacterium]|nr:DUF222 domain-containing protein [Acidimicrobiia bacterium]